MPADFSFGKLMKHLVSGATLDRPQHAPSEEHMRAALQGYIDNLNNPNPEFAAKFLAEPRSGEDPVGTEPFTIGGNDENVLEKMSGLIDVPFVPKKAELLAPITFSLGNSAAMAFRLWAEVDGRDLSIDIIETVEFDEEGRICKQMAYWGVGNVNILD